MKRLEGRVAIITGAAHGEKAALGAFIAKALAAEGASVAVADLSDCSSVAREIEAAGGAALAVEADVADERSVNSLVQQTLARFGRVDILVNNAALGSNVLPISLEAITLQDWDRHMAVNVRGPFLCVRAVLATMRANRYGKIINVGSTTVAFGLPNRLHYVASKGAVHAMTRGMARELGVDGIRVNTIVPGGISGPSIEAARAQIQSERDVIVTRSLKQDLSADDLRGALVFLASAESDAITGQFLIVDNGTTFV
jgi:NAD(P)-dependent dehydrogenase (short-subunit alcohol dehydrogenase family)